MCGRPMIGLVGCAEAGPGFGRLAGPAEAARFYPVGLRRRGFKQRNDVTSNILLTVV